MVQRRDDCFLPDLRGKIASPFQQKIVEETAFYGNFAIGPQSGRQTGHRVLLVQWHHGRKVIIEPESADAGTLELPSGFRLIVASFQRLLLTRKGDERQEANDDGD